MKNTTVTATWQVTNTTQVLSSTTATLTSTSLERAMTTTLPYATRVTATRKYINFSYNTQTAVSASAGGQTSSRSVSFVQITPTVGTYASTLGTITSSRGNVSTSATSSSSGTSPTPSSSTNVANTSTLRSGASTSSSGLTKGATSPTSSLQTTPQSQGSVSSQLASGDTSSKPSYSTLHELYRNPDTDKLIICEFGDSLVINYIGVKYPDVYILTCIVIFFIIVSIDELQDYNHGGANNCYDYNVILHNNIVDRFFNHQVNDNHVDHSDIDYDEAYISFHFHFNINVDINFDLYINNDRKQKY